MDTDYLLHTADVLYMSQSHHLQKDVEIRRNTYPFSGYKNVFGNIFQMVMETPDAVILDLGFGTGTIMNGRERTSWIE